ncbi:MAG: ABC transporter substrate-binding protein, partial [Candidatus Dormibacteraeota bacterium]|nr:ABC transporter substrate-binding protein [Candidatus Dormibacteraeota bacterium]
NRKLSDPLVRQALNYAVDKQAIIQKIQFGAAQPLTAPMAPSVFGYCNTKGTASYAYNPAKAKQLLQQAGAEGMTLTLGSPQGHYAGDYQTAQAVAADLEAVGLQVTVPNPPTWPSYIAETRVPPSKATLDMNLRGWAPSYLDASEMFQPFEQSQFGPGPNLSYWYSTQTDSLINQAQSTTNKPTAQSDYCQAAKQIWEAAPWIWLYLAENPILTTSHVKNVYGLPNEEFMTAFARPTS